MAILHVAFFILEKLEKDKKEGSLIKKLKGDKHLATWRLALSYDVLALLLLQFFLKKIYFHMFLHYFVLILFSY